MKINTEYDVIVIGGGPAGSTFGRIAASNGLSVVILDKRKEFGIPVRCGEGLGAREVVREGLELPPRVISTHIAGAKVVAPNGKEIIWKDEETKGWVLERKFFDKWLVEKAVEKGVHAYTYMHVLDLIKENGKIVGVKVQHGAEEPFEIRAKMVVSAEGMEAHIAKKAGFDTIHKLYDVDTCYEYEMKPYHHQNLIELYFGNKLAPRGYVWIFPKKGDRANVGIGIGGTVVNGDKWGIPGANPKPLLDDFIVNNEQLKDASTLDDFGGVISVGAPLNEFVKDNFMVIGTAAKQVDPIHGGGIALAMEAGVLAGQVASKAFEKKDFSKQMLYEYEDTWRKTTGKKLAHRLLLRKVLEKLNDDDLNHIIGSITQDDLKEVMYGKFAKTVMKVVAGRPQLLKVLSALLPNNK